jgi:hypothetical protein
LLKPGAYGTANLEQRSNIVLMTLYRDANGYNYMVTLPHSLPTIDYSPKTALIQLSTEYILYVPALVGLQVMSYAPAKIRYQFFIDIYPGYLTPSHGETQGQGKAHETQSKHAYFFHMATSSNNS